MEKSMLNEILEVMEINNSFEDEMAEIFLEKCKEYTDYEEIIDEIDKGNFAPSSGCISALMHYNQTHKILRKHFEEILKIINNDFEEYYGEEYRGGLDSKSLVWTAFEVLIDRWCEAIPMLME